MRKNRKASMVPFILLFSILICTLLIIFFYIGAKDKVSSTDATSMRLVSHQMSQHEFFLFFLTRSSLVISSENSDSVSSHLKQFARDYFQNTQNSASCKKEPNAIVCTLTSNIPLVESSVYQSFYNEGSYNSYSAYVPSQSGKPILFTLNLWVGA